MSALRFAYPFPPNEFIQVDGHGQLKGEAKPLFEEALIYFRLKYNLSWVIPKKDLIEGGDTLTDGLNLIEQDRVDGTFSVLHLFKELPQNCTVGPTMFDGWCRIVTFPGLASVELTDGPEVAFKQLRIEYVILMLIGLFMMIYSARMSIGTSNVLTSTWCVYVSLVRQSVPPILRKSFFAGYIVLILATFFLTTLFGCFLHTERTSITSFVRIDSFEDIHEHNMTTLVLDISPCSLLMRKQYNYRVVQILDRTNVANTFKVCMARNNCATLLSSIDFSIMLSMRCTLFPKRAIEHPPYLSPIMIKTMGGVFLNKRMAKKERNRVGGYVQRSFEMGLEKKKGPTSDDLGKKFVKLAIQLDMSEECLSTTIGSSFSTPVPLGIEFFKDFFALYFVILLFGVAIQTYFRCTRRASV